MNRLDPALPVVVDKAYITGSERTKDSYLEAELKAILQQNLPLNQFNHELNKAVSRLQSSGQFEYIHTDLNIKHVDENNRFHTDININLKEKGIPYLKFETYVKSKSSCTATNEVGFEIIGALRNPLGLGDMHKLSYSTNSSGGLKEYQFSSHFPHAISSLTNNTKDDNAISQSYYSKHLDVTFKSSDDDNSYFLKYKQKSSSLVFDITPALSFTSSDSQQGHISRKSNIFNAHPTSEHKYQIELCKRDEIPSHGVATYTSAASTATSMKNLYGNNRAINESSIDKEVVTTKMANKVTYPNASVLSQLFPSTKLSLKHIYTILDTRDNINCPTQGSFLQSNTEFATPVGTAQFIKTEWLTQYHRSFGLSLYGLKPVLSLSGSLGLILPWKMIQNKLMTRNPNPLGLSHIYSSSFVHMSDRYHLGGPFSLRGFQLYGVDYQNESNEMIRSINITSNNVNNETETPLIDNGASLGGISKCTLLMSLSVPVPMETLAKAGARAFGFINIGGIGQPHIYDFVRIREKNHKISFPPLFGPMRMSIGGGFAIPLGSNARLELTYAVPVVRASTDIVKPFQIGVGMTIS